MQRILISGGGIAGLTAAYWLKRHGFQPVVAERSKGLRRDGYGLDFYSTGYDVAQRMGLIGQLSPQVMLANYVGYVNRAGEITAKLSIESMRQAMDGKYLPLMHYTIEETLYEAVKDGVEIRFDSSMAQVQQDAGGVHATFEDGRAETYDLLVGADGIHSNVRGLVFGPESQFAVYMGYYVACYRVADRYGQIDGWQNYADVGRQVGVYPSDRPGELVTLFMWEAPDEGWVAPDKRLPRLRSVFEGMGWIAGDLLDDAPAGEEIFMDTVTQIRMPTWRKGRVALVGDAAGCMTLISGQGASMAMGSSYILAEELARASDHQSAFAYYEHRVRPQVELRQEKARDFAKSFVPGSELGLAAQRVMMKVLLRDAFRGVLKRQFMVESILESAALHRLPQSGGNVLGYRISGKLQATDYQTFGLDVEDVVAAHGSVRLLLQLDEISGVEPKAMLADLRFGKEHGRQVERLATVGDSRLASLAAEFSKPFYAQSARHFETQAVDEAWAWLQPE